MNFKIALLIISVTLLVNVPITHANERNNNTSSELGVDQYQRPKKGRSRVISTRKYKGPRITNRNKHYIRRRRGISSLTHIISGAVGSGLNYDKFMSFKGSYDYRINAQFSAGVQGSLIFQDVTFKLHRAINLGLRGNYHFLDPGNVFDVYGGLSLGTDLGLDQEGSDHSIFGNNNSEMKLNWDIHIGGRYKLTNQWMTYIELSKRYSVIGIAFSF